MRETKTDYETNAILSLFDHVRKLETQLDVMNKRITALEEPDRERPDPIEILPPTEIKGGQRVGHP